MSAFFIEGNGMSDQIDYEQFVRGMGDAVVISNAQGDIVLWNKAAERDALFSLQGPSKQLLKYRTILF